MEALSNLLGGFAIILTPANLYLCFLGSLIGTLVGVLPGVGPLAALALLLPVTFTLSPLAGLVMLCSIFYGAMYGGSITSVLLNIPGEAASVVTCLDGHQIGAAGARRRGARHRGNGLLHCRHGSACRDDSLRSRVGRDRDPLRAAGEFRADGAGARLHAVS